MFAMLEGFILLEESLSLL